MVHQRTNHLKLIRPFMVEGVLLDVVQPPVVDDSSYFCFLIPQLNLENLAAFVHCSGQLIDWAIVQKFNATVVRCLGDVTEISHQSWKRMLKSIYSSFNQ
jgi:hypothetical protein